MRGKGVLGGGTSKSKGKAASVAGGEGRVREGKALSAGLRTCPAVTCPAVTGRASEGVSRGGRSRLRF